MTADKIEDTTSASVWPRASSLNGRAESGESRHPR
jgi:hypothetical protein